MNPLTIFSNKLVRINNTYKAKNAMSEFGYYQARYKICIFEQKEFSRNLCNICEENLLENFESKNCEDCKKILLLISLITSRI